MQFDVSNTLAHDNAIDDLQLMSGDQRRRLAQGLKTNQLARLFHIGVSVPGSFTNLSLSTKTYEAIVTHIQNLTK